MRAAAVRIARTLRAAGHEALFAGGCVRDRLRGKDPDDIDVATSARPDEVQALFPRTFAVGAAFGVVVVVDGEASVEVATFREDVGSADGRRPESVRFADARADARRRDFTVNGMFEDPETGEVLDFVGGRADLARGVVRTIGEPSERFREDRLRILRAVRFATTLDFVLDRPTRRAVHEHAPAIRDVSAERIGVELTKILVSGRGGRGVGLLREAGLLDLLLPEVAALDGVPQPALFHPEGDVLTHTRMLLDAFDTGGPAVAWAALLHDIGKAPTIEINRKGRLAFPRHAPVGADMTEEVLRRFRFPNKLVDQVRDLVARHMDWPQVPRMREGKRRRLLLRDDLPLHLELHRLDCDACHRMFGIHEELTAEHARLLAEPPPVRPLIDGHELRRLGYTPGPPFRAILDDLVEAQLEGRVTTMDEARAYVQSRFAAPDGRPLATSEEA